MLITADRNFYSFALWGKFRDAGADLLWRVKSNLRLPLLRWLPDGSYLSLVCSPKIDGQRRSDLIRKAEMASLLTRATAATLSGLLNTMFRTGKGTELARSSARSHRYLIRPRPPLKSWLPPTTIDGNVKILLTR